MRTAALAFIGGLLLGAPAARAAAPMPAALGGFDLALTLTEASGLAFVPEGYQNQLSATLSGSFAVGRRFFQGRWAEPLEVSGELSLGAELAGNDPSFRGSSFGSAALLLDAPERLALTQGVVPDRVDGLGRRAVLSDLALAASHRRVVTLPGEVVLGASLRALLPTSRASQVAGLLAAPSLAVGARRGFGPVEVGLELRAVKYLFRTAIAPIESSAEPVLVNGLEVEPYRPSSSGYPNPSHGLVSSLSAALELPRSLSLGADYALINTWAHALSGCEVEGVPTADVCRDGPRLGYVQPLGQRDTHAFSLELGYEPLPWGALALGLATTRPLRAPSGELANPFLHVSRDNYSTLYLSFTVKAAGLVGAARPNPSEASTRR